MSDNYQLFVGIDWASTSHQVCVLDADLRILTERAVEHSCAGLFQLVDLLMELSKRDPARVGIAIETPHGPVVELLVERGFHVFAVNPKQLDRFRDRHTVAGAKDDRRDAFVLGDSLRTDPQCFRRVTVEGPITLQLRELSRVDEDLRQEANRLQNRLREQLHRYVPQWLHLSPAVDEPWFWDLLELASTPEKAARLRSARIVALLKSHRIRRLSAEQVLVELKAPALQVAPGAVEAATAHVALLLPRLRLVQQQRLHCAKEISRLLELHGTDEEPTGYKREHRDVQVLRSLPGVGIVVSATMLAEAQRAIADRDYHALRALAGIAPVTYRSGKMIRVRMRHGCNERLRYALYHWTRVASQIDPICRSIYRSQRKRGNRHGRALRSVGDHLLRILMAMLRDNTLYDPKRPRRVPPGAAEEVAA